MPTPAMVWARLLKNSLMLAPVLAETSAKSTPICWIFLEASEVATFLSVLRGYLSDSRSVLLPRMNMVASSPRTSLTSSTHLLMFENEASSASGKAYW